MKTNTLCECVLTGELCPKCERELKAMVEADSLVAAPAKLRDPQPTAAYRRCGTKIPAWMNDPRHDFDQKY